jgi:hypothetical protein
MNEYQSIELHHWASKTFYDSYSGDPPYLDPVDFNGSAFSGGQIAFIEDENISFYEAELKEKYGPPVEVDREYLNMILDKKKLKVSLDIDSEFDVGDLTPNTVTGNLEGSFDCCDIYIISDHLDVVNEGAAWCRRDISSKVAQLNPKGDNGSLYDTLQGIYFDDSSVPLDELGLYGWGIEDLNINVGGVLRPQMLPTAMWSANHDAQRYDPYTGITTIVPLENYSMSNSNELSGNYTFNASIHTETWAFAGVGCAVGFIVVTPTKVYAFPNVGGAFGDPNEGVTTLFTSIETDTYPAYNTEDYLIPISFPSYASSTMTFLGVEIPVYFYHPSGDSTGPTFGEYEGLSLIGTSFDVSVEEAW